MLNKLLFIIAIAFLAVSCEEKNEESLNQPHTPKQFTIAGYEIPSDSIKTIENQSLRNPQVNPSLFTLYKNPIEIVDSNITPLNQKLVTKAYFKVIEKQKLKNTIIKLNAEVVEMPEPTITLAGTPKFSEKNLPNFQNYSMTEGLISNCAHDIIIDRKNNAWIATMDGISKYNGKYFVQYKLPKTSDRLQISRIAEDKNGNIWFSDQSENTTYQFDGIKLLKYKGFNTNFIKGKNGAIYFHKNDSLIEYNGENFTFKVKTNLLTSGWLSLIDSKNNFWFGTDENGVYKFDGETFYKLIREDDKQNKYVYKIAEDKEGNIWMGYSNLVKFDGENVYEFDGLRGLAVWNIFNDVAGDIWVGTWGNGLLKITNNEITNYNTENGLCDNVIFSINQDSYNNYWFGSFNGGFSIYNNKGIKGLKFNTSDYTSNPYATFYQIHKGKTNDIYINHDGNEILKYSKNKSYTLFKCNNSDYHIEDMFIDSENRIWFISNGLGIIEGDKITYYSEKDNSIFKFSRSITQNKFGNICIRVFKNEPAIITLYEKNYSIKYMPISIVKGYIDYLYYDSKGNEWLGARNGIVKFDGSKHLLYHDTSGNMSTYSSSIKEDIKGNYWIGSTDGLIKFNGNYFLKFNEEQGLSHSSINNFLFDKNQNLWINTYNGLNLLTQETQKNNNFLSKNTLFNVFNESDGYVSTGYNNRSGIVSDSFGNVYIGDRAKIHVIQPESKDIMPPIIELYSIKLFGENISWKDLNNNKENVFNLKNGVSISAFRLNGLEKFANVPIDLSLNYQNNNLTFCFIGVTTNKPKKVQYSYILEGYDKNWSTEGSLNEITYGNLAPNDYTFKVKAMNGDGYWSHELSYSFTIRPPWWQTWWFRTLAGTFLISCIVFYIKWRERSLKIKQQVLEKKIAIATEDIKEQKHLIEEKHKEITDSINYAERIQRSLLASSEILNNNLPDHFIFFKPKDVVSGDFYWANLLSNNQFALVTADSTGHGVPGAIMSILNISCLEKSIESEKLSKPAEILNHTRLKIIETLKKDGSKEGGKDGMDATLICFDFKNNKMTYSSANNPIWIVRNNELIELKGDKMPVGKHDKDHVPFTQYEFEMNKGDMIYTLTDGFPDQFGGPKGKKFMYKQLKETLISISIKSLNEQKEILQSTLKEWMGDTEQVDDITIIGIKI